MKKLEYTILSLKKLILFREFVINNLPKMTQLFFVLRMLKKASITGYLSLFLVFLKGKRASQMGRLFFTNSLKTANLMTLFFIATLLAMPTLNAQVANTIQSSSKLNKGESVTINFESHRADEVVDYGRWKNKAIDEQTIEIDFLIENTSNLNPYESAYKYSMELLDENAFRLEMTAALDPMSMRISEDFSIEYQGDWIYFPANLEKLPQLPAAKGVFSIKKPDGSKLLDYHVEITNRKVQLDSNDKIEGNVYKHTYDLHFKNIINGNIIVVESHQQIEELLSPYMGMLQQTRTISHTINATGTPDNKSKRVEKQNTVAIKSIECNAN